MIRYFSGTLMLLVSQMIENRLQYLMEYLLTQHQNKPTLSNEPMRMCKCYSSIFTCTCVTYMYVLHIVWCIGLQLNQHIKQWYP